MIRFDLIPVAADSMRFDSSLGSGDSIRFDSILVASFFDSGRQHHRGIVVICCAVDICVVAGVSIDPIRFDSSLSDCDLIRFDPIPVASSCDSIRFGSIRFPSQLIRCDSIRVSVTVIRFDSI